MKADDKMWDKTVFSKNRDRLLRGEIIDRLMEVLIAYARKSKLTSDEHFTVYETLVEAWVILKSFRKKR